MKFTRVKAEITIVDSSSSDCHITVLIPFLKTCVDLSQHASIKANLSSNAHEQKYYLVRYAEYCCYQDKIPNIRTLFVLLFIQGNGMPYYIIVTRV